MKRNAYLLSIPIMLVLLGTLAGCIRGAESGESQVPVDDQVLAALEESGWSQVCLALKQPADFELPGPEANEDTFTKIWDNWDWDLYEVANAEMRANVLSVLGPEDFVLGGEQTGSISGNLSVSGLQKLRYHPDLAHISWPLGRLFSSR